MVLFNFYPVAKGGGLQNAYSFIIEMSKSQPGYDYVCVVRAGTGLDELCRKLNVPHIKLEGGRLNRIKFELFQFYSLCKKLKPNVIFTLFGNPPLLKTKCPSISGFARSNIIERDVHFWGFLPYNKYLIKKVGDFAILWLMKRSNLIILETERLARLAKNYNTFPDSIIKVIPMSPSASIVSDLNMLSSPDIQCIKEVRILYISGCHPNKNIDKLPILFKELNTRAENKVQFKLVTTLPYNNYYDYIKCLFQENGLNDNLINIGPIPQDELPKYIKNVHALINVAELESFSNNWVEAWASKRLLICREAEYASESCQSSAIYVDLTDPIKSSKLILEVFNSKTSYSTYVENGNKLVNSLPTSREKYLKYMECINEFL